MSRSLDWLLAGWTLAAATWWTVAICLVAARGKNLRSLDTHDDHRPRRSSGESRHSPAESQWRRSPDLRPPTENQVQLSIFKPLPPLRSTSPDALATAIESFVAQLDDSVELLLGIEEQDGPVWKPVLKEWEQRYPLAQVRYVCQPRPLDLISPKVSWHRVLSRYATGPLWLWSDADIIAPPGLLQQMCRECDGGLVTCLYVIRQVEVAPQMLETLFVNVETVPGVLACERAGALRFALGAAMLFRAEDFHQRVDWPAVSRMAEDCVMGQRLQPVRLSAMTVETLAAERHWRDAVLHYLRWQKTVRWNQPIGFAGLVLIMPAVGWLAAGRWLGLAVTLAMEATVAVWLCRAAGCRLRWGQAWVLPVWSLLRPVVWVLCWLPIPVVFRSQGRVWSSLNRSTGQ